MTFNKKPPFLQFGDFIAFGLGGVVCFGFLIFGLVSGFHGDSAAVKQAPYLLALCGAAFIGIYSWVVWLRKQKYDMYELIGSPEYGFMVDWGGYNPGSDRDTQFLACVNAMIAGWSNVFRAQQVLSVIEKDYIYVSFLPGIQTNPQTGQLVYGWTQVRTVVISYMSPTAAMASTALGHEIGNVIQGNITNDWDETTMIKRAADNKLP